MFQCTKSRCSIAARNNDPALSSSARAQPVSAAGDDSDASSTTRRSGWDPAPRKRLVVSALPKDAARCSLVDYEWKKRSRICLVEFENAKAEEKRAWIHEKDLVNREAFAYQFQKIDAWKAWLKSMKSEEYRAREEQGRLGLKDFVKTRQGAALSKRLAAHGDDDSGEGNCGYIAAGIVMEELGYPNLVTKERIDKFKANGGRRRGVNPANFYGVTEIALRAFINSLGVPVRLSKNLYRGHLCGVEGLKALNLPDGYYLVAGRERGLGPGGTGHIFVAQVSWSGEEVTIHEKDELQNVAWLLTWLHRISWVIRVDPVIVME